MDLWITPSSGKSAEVRRWIVAGWPPFSISSSCCLLFDRSYLLTKLAEKWGVNIHTSQPSALRSSLHNQLPDLWSLPTRPSIINQQSCRWHIWSNNQHSTTWSLNVPVPVQRTGTGTRSKMHVGIWMSIVGSDHRSGRCLLIVDWGLRADQRSRVGGKAEEFDRGSLRLREDNLRVWGRLEGKGNKNKSSVNRIKN